MSTARCGASAEARASSARSASPTSGLRTFVLFVSVKAGMEALQEKLVAVVGYEAVERHAGAAVRLVGAEQQLGAIAGEDDAEHVERELAGVGVRAQLAVLHCHVHGLADLPAERALALDDRVAHRSRLVVVLAGRRVDGAATRKARALRPVDPPVEGGL